MRCCTTPRQKDAERIPPPEKANPTNPSAVLGPVTSAPPGSGRGSPAS